VTVRAYNNDADARTFTVAFTDVPDDWTVESFDGTADRVDEGRTSSRSSPSRAASGRVRP